MSDFGTEVGNAGIQTAGNVATKVLSALLALLNKIFELWKDRHKRTLEKAEATQIKDKIQQKRFADKIDGKVGFVKHSDLVKAGIPLAVTGVTMTNEELKVFAARCKREGILISAVADQRDLSLDGKKTFIVECKQSDLERLAKAIDLMNDEKRIEAIDNRIGDILQKGNENLTAQDRTDISSLESQRKEIKRKYCYDLNDEQAYGITEKTANGETLRGISFNAAIDRYTGGTLDNETTCIIADASDPTRYIKCHSFMDTYKEDQYTKTTYEIYNGDKKVYATHDGRFNGRPKDYWIAEKARMKENGGIGDTVFKFYTVSEYERFVQSYRTQNALELNGLHLGELNRDYVAMISQLESKLDKDGAVLTDGAVLEKVSHKALTLSQDMNLQERATVAEALVIGKQISNYKQLMTLETELSVANAEVLTTADGSPEHLAAVAKYESLDAAYKAALSTEVDLINERMSVNAVQAEQDSREYVEDREESELSADRDTRGGDTHHSLEDYKEAIRDDRGAAAKDAGSLGHESLAHIADKKGAVER